MALDEFSVRSNGHAAAIHGAETVLAPRKLLSPSDSSDDSMREEARRRVALVEGSTPHLSAETRDLLRSRLRITAILFFVGFSAFLVRSLFYWDNIVATEHLPLFITHGVVAIVLGAFAIGLCRHCSYTLRQLRVLELVIFGCPALFFLVNAIEETNALMNLTDGRAR